MLTKVYTSFGKIPKNTVFAQDQALFQGLGGINIAGYQLD